MKSLAKTTSTTAAVASATGALFALQHQAEAAVVYSGIQNITTSLIGHYTGPYSALAISQVFLDKAEIRDAVFRYRSQAGAGLLPSANIHLLLNQRINGYPLSLKKLAAGNVISAPQFAGLFIQNSFVEVLRFFSGGGAPLNGSWAKDQTGLVAFQETNGDLGWLRLEWTTTDSNPEPSSITLIDYAYDTTPGESIQAGQTTSSAPEPSRALLLLAGLGSMALRRRRKQEA